MKKMTLGDWAQLSEIVAAIAVVVSLIYVGIGLRDNTASVRSAALQAVTSASQASLLAQASDPGLSRVRRVGDDDFGKLTEDEKYQYVSFYRQYWLGFQNVYLQRNLNVVGSEQWGTYQRIMCQQFTKPGVRETWQTHAEVLDPTFVETAELCAAGDPAEQLAD